MRTQSIKMLGVAVATIAIASAPAVAQGTPLQVLRGQQQAQTRQQRAVEREQQRERERAIERERRDDGRIYRSRDNDRDGKWKKGKKVPPGLAKKPGHMPPGQYKKRYGTDQGASVLGDIFRRDGYTVVRTVPRDGSQYVYYRTRTGTERRAIVTQGDERLSFSNVPQSVLEQVLSALYR